MSVHSEQSRSSETLSSFLASTRLAIYLLILITLACLVGIFLPQKGVTLDPDAYLRLTAQPFWQILDRLGFLNVFSSVWFLLLIALMTLNLVFCSYKGILRIRNRIRSSPEILTPHQAKAQGYHRVLQNPSIHPDFLEKTLLPLGKPERKERNGEIHYRFEKGALALYAPFFVHGSIILMILGAMVDMFAGLDARMNIPEGRSSDVISVFSNRGGVQKFRLPFEVLCEDFDLEVYEGTNQPKDYRSILTIRVNGQAVASKNIEVNDPLTWKGFRFFQSSYGPMQQQAEIEITRRKDGARQQVLVPVMETVEVKPFTASVTPSEAEDQAQERPPGLIGVAVMEIKENFQGNGAAVRIAILREDGNPEPFWLFQQSPDYDDLRNGPYKFRLRGIQSGFYTGLMVVKKPGASLIWIGCGLFMTALFWGYTVSHRRAWIRFGNGEILIAGSSNRSKESWYRRLDEVAERLERA